MENENTFDFGEIDLKNGIKFDNAFFEKASKAENIDNFEKASNKFFSMLGVPKSYLKNTSTGIVKRIKHDSRLDKQDVLILRVISNSFFQKRENDDILYPEFFKKMINDFLKYKGIPLFEYLSDGNLKNFFPSVKNKDELDLELDRNLKRFYRKNAKLKLQKEDGITIMVEDNQLPNE